jgi:hypothetical protein
LRVRLVHRRNDAAHPGHMALHVLRSCYPKEPNGKSLLVLLANGTTRRSSGAAGSRSGNQGGQASTATGRCGGQRIEHAAVHRSRPSFGRSTTPLQPGSLVDKRRFVDRTRASNSFSSLDPVSPSQNRAVTCPPSVTHVPRRTATPCSSREPRIGARRPIPLRSTVARPESGLRGTPQPVVAAICTSRPA